MFYKMVQAARDRWFSSPACTVKDLVQYMVSRGKLRDAQVEAVKTYLYLKIACGSRPLAQLFSLGTFNSLNVDTIQLTGGSYKYLKRHPAAVALLEYAMQTGENRKAVSPKLAKAIKDDPAAIDYKKVFHSLFYGYSYADYLFSLPMGAGKTYLMAMFIYLDLYFAMNEPANPAFAHNFIIFAPSGLKSSVVPSLKTIQNFDPSWIIPEPAASEVKRLMSFEVLDQPKSESKSTKAKNPNVQKIASHQPLPECMGLVLVTNAEKVILNRVKLEKGSMNLFEGDDEKDRKANELRNLIGKIPHLSVFIDEVHHAVGSEIKLRAVINKWAGKDGQGLNSVIGFSGTPYLEKPEKFEILPKLKLASSQITTIVYYYPLIQGIGNFLKKPVVKIADIPDSAAIVEEGVREFLNRYKDTVYGDGCAAKLGIYCGTIEKLEETVYPLVARIAAEYGLGEDTILKFHRGNKTYPMPADSQMQFDMLDTSISQIRIILLVQIGKEGWDCKSLTGIVLSQEGDCPTNMVLQTSCRCLREEDDAANETALVYLNDSNAEKLEMQLQAEHHMNIKEFQTGETSGKTIKRYSRIKYLKLPKVEFYQLKVEYKTFITREKDIREELLSVWKDLTPITGRIKTTDFSMKEEMQGISTYAKERGEEPATFYSWLYGIVKNSVGTLKLEDLLTYQTELRQIYDRLTVEEDAGRVYSSLYDREAAEAAVRKAFCVERDAETVEELIPEKAGLLHVDNFSGTVYTDTPEEYYPSQPVVEGIIAEDKGKSTIPAKVQKYIDLMEADGDFDLARQARARYMSQSHPQKDRSFHYLPYHMDSPFERTYLQEILPDDLIREKNLEMYYNGDRSLTEFRIKCYKQHGKAWDYIGMYTPDFLIIQRKNKKIYKALIIETKGEGYANETGFKDKRTFTEGEFIRLNNEKFHYRRFGYLYIEDSLNEKQRAAKTRKAIQELFTEA